jgi:putrescine transport system permease protein
MSTQANRRNWRARLVVLLPYLWLVIFFLVPFVIVLKISLSQTALAQPPYVPVFDLAAGWAGLMEFTTQLSVDSFRLLSSDSIYLLSYLKSLQIDRFFGANRQQINYHLVSKH